MFVETEEFVEYLPVPGNQVSSEALDRNNIFGDVKDFQIGNFVSMTNRVDDIGARKLGRKGDKIGNVERDLKRTCMFCMGREIWERVLIC